MKTILVLLLALPMTVFAASGSLQVGPVGNARSIQSVPVSTTTPTAGQTLVYNSTSNQWVPGVTSSGSVTLSGDVTGASGANTVIKLQGVNISSTTPTSGQVLSFNSTSSQWTPSPGTSPASTNGAVQFNSSGSFGGDATKFFWDNTNKRLGVGLNAPVNSFHADGNVVGAYNGLMISNEDPTAGNTANINFAHGNPGVVATGRISNLNEDGSNIGLTFSTYNGVSLGERMRLSGSGNLGIGTNAPANILDVKGAVAVGSSYVGTTGPSNGMIIQGNVGFGNTSPQKALDIVGTMRLRGSVSGQVDINTISTPTSYTLTLPPNRGSNGNIISTDGTGQINFTSLSGIIDAISSTQGDILYRSASAWVGLDPGTAGQALQTGGAGANPSWVTAPGTSHFKSTGTAPSAAPGAANTGAGAACSVSHATDVAGLVSITFGATAAGGIQCSITFNSAYGVAPICQLVPTNSTTAILAEEYVSTSTSILSIGVAGGTLTGTVNYAYQCIETQ